QILQTLNAAINDIVKSPDVEKKLSDMGFDPITGSQPQADSMFAAEVKKWGDMVTALGLSIK
ncbi:MAG: tripartite tricarboxylate transporter substrate-binding protein, partial [Xanthobacteraceae bacterium]